MNISEFILKDGEKPLDRIAPDGGFCSIFRTVGFVGDSLSSGEFQSLIDGENEYHDMYEYSWGQYIARMCGLTAYNFSRGGMTAKEYCDTFAEQNGCWDSLKKCQAYVIALGVNDINRIEMYNGNFGKISDVCPQDYTKNKPTFAGYFAQIIQRYKQLQPDAKFFFVTMPNMPSDDEKYAKMCDEHARLMHELAQLFNNSYVIDLRKYAPVYDDEFHKAFYLNGHMNACGYVLTAKMVASYIDYIIRSDFDSFKRVGFIGTKYYITEG